MTKSFLTQFAHMFFGGLTSVLVFIHPVLSIINTAVFIIYELEQSRHKKDPAYEEILEFMMGLAAGEMLILLMIISRKIALLLS